MFPGKGGIKVIKRASYVGKKPVAIYDEIDDELIKYIPEIVARREVVEYNDGSVDTECSNCGWPVPKSGTRYCAQCGAKLEG
jgi:hypothetical protein